MVEDDFRALALDGAQFEALVCALLEAMKFRVESRPAVGPDGGKDILVERATKDPMHESRERVVVQCKHYATSGRGVAEAHVGVWTNAMTRHGARGYLLVTDSRLTTNLRDAFEAYTKEPSSPGQWARYWDVDTLLQLLQQHPDIRRTFFPGRDLDIDPPPEVGQLIQQLETLSEQSDRAFDQGDWQVFSTRVAETRKTLTEMARRDSRDHFAMYYHVKRARQFPRLQQLLSTLQLAYERYDEGRLVDHTLSLPATPRSFDEFATAVGRLDAFRSVTFDLTRREADWLTTFAPDPRRLVMVGCGALPYTLLHACWAHPLLTCTGLDYDNGSLVAAHRVRKHLRLDRQLHYVTQNGHVFDYRDNDVILIANIVSQKREVLERVAATAPQGAVVVVRNPVTFGECLWEDAQYTHFRGLEPVGRFDANPFGECFETVALLKVW